MIDTEAAAGALPRPAPAEYHEYYGRYIDLVPAGNILFTLEEQLAGTLQLLAEVPPELETYRYAEGKWSLRQVLGHLIDVERTFEFRALAMARSDGVDLPGMDQEVWAARNAADERPLADLIEEWKAVRRAAVHLFATFDEEAGARIGHASGRTFTVRCFPWIIAGHELWHRNIIREKYVGQ